MILKSVRVKNFRSIRDETLHCDDLTVLVGANGSGKSSFLHAVDLFQSRSPGITEDDYHGRQTEDDIEITATFRNLSGRAAESFGDYILDGELAVVRVLKWEDGRCGTAYHGIRLQNPDFAGIYDQKAGVAKQNYEELLEGDAYRKFPAWAGRAKTAEFLRQWERENPGRCERVRDDGKFFKPGPDGQGFLDGLVRFLYIRPVRDAAEDAQEEKGSVLATLMGLAVKNSLGERDDIREFAEGAQKRYRSLMHLAERDELDRLGGMISDTIRRFVPDARIDLSWHSTDLKIEPPKAEISLVEDGYRSTVARAGHGLQRIFIMSILQHLAEAQTGGTGRDPDESPALVLAIDEPELYQHPNRQRHMSQVLLSLASGRIPGVSRETQIIYSTHSPHFVGIDRLDRIRLLRKAGGAGGPGETRICSTSLGEVAAELSAILGPHGTAGALAPGLQVIMTPVMNEGFFADVVVLVEGEGDRAALMATAESAGCALESLGVSVIPCGGKPNLGRPAVIFRRLGIPVYLVWDSDGGKNRRNPWLNRALLSVMGQRPEDWPSGVWDTFACFESNLEDTMRKEIGRKFGAYLGSCRREMCIAGYGAVKKPYVISGIIERAGRDGLSCRTLEEIVRRITGLCPGRASRQGGLPAGADPEGTVPCG